MRPQDYFQLLQEAFEEAPGRADKRLSVAGLGLELRLAGGVASRLYPALCHLECQVEPDFSLLAWAGGDLPERPWSDSQLLGGGVVQGWNDERFLTTYQSDRGLLTMVDTRRRTALYWAPDALGLPYYESGSPFRTALNRWLAQRDRFMVHAATVARGERGLLLAGRGGSGKSSTALRCLAAGLGLLSEDYTVVTLEEVPRAFCLYRSVKLDRQDVPAYPALGEPANRPEQDEKALYFLEPNRLTREVELRAVLLPRVVDRSHTSIRPASRAQALLALAPATLLQLRGDGRAAGAMAELVRRLPCYFLELGRTGVAQTLEEFLCS